MLTDGIAAAYRQGRDRVAGTEGVREVLTSVCDRRNATPYLFETTGEPGWPITRWAKRSSARSAWSCARAMTRRCWKVARSLDGQLTCTLHLDAGDTDLAQQ
jgi:2,5-dioxopentanoate dehydrogenase